MFFARVLDTLSSATSASTPPALASAAQKLLALYVLGAALRFLDVFLLRTAGARVVAAIRKALFSALVRADVQMLEKTTSGELLSRLGTDTVLVQRILTDDLVKCLQGILEISVGSVMLFCVHTRLALFVYACVPLVVAATVWTGRTIADTARKSTAALAHATEIAAEQLDGIKIVKSFGREAYAEKKYYRAVVQVLRLAHILAKVEAALQMWNRAVFQTMTCAILYFGGKMVLAGSLTIGGMMAFVLYASNVVAAAGKITAGLAEIYAGAGSLQRIINILATKPTIETSTKYRKTGNAIGYQLQKGAQIHVRNVSFAYAAGPTVLQNIHFNVPAGSSVAFVGQSGGGKSTMVSLLSRFYDPLQGDIFLDGKNLKEYDITDLRTQIVGIVSQDMYVITGTLAENIAFGRENATRQEIEDAAQAAGVMQFARRMENGLDTKVTKLSGGEQQRLMIARCLCKRPKIMILDEPTAALDAKSEQLVNQTIRQLIQDESITVVLISHRLKMVTECHHVLVFDSGKLTEQGTHQELLQRNGAYWRLLNAAA